MPLFIGGVVGAGFFGAGGVGFGGVGFGLTATGAADIELGLGLELGRVVGVVVGRDGMKSGSTVTPSSCNMA